MRRTFNLIGIAALASAVPVTGALALDAVAMTELNVRAGPGTEFPVVTTIAENGGVDIHGCMENWCDLTWQGTRGWSYAPYLAAVQGEDRVIVTEAGQTVEVPAAEFEVSTYWDQHYRDRPFYEEREQFISGGAAAGATTGAVIGAVTGGPVGAAVGAVAGGAVGTAIDPPDRVRTYVVENPVDPVVVQGEVVVGVTLPEPVTLHPVPDYEYTYAIVNRQPVLVEPGTRRVVYVYR